MFRSEADINYAFNCLALACLETESRLLADSEMTTHTHWGLCTDNPQAVFSKFRFPYTRYFNSKYMRRGRLGEKSAFYLEVDGIHHTLTLLSYIYRQALHHGLSNSPFEYSHNSINVIFQKLMGKKAPTDILEKKYMAKFLPRPTRDIPDGYRMSTSGLLLREDVIDTSYVEELFISPRNFMYLMNRPSSDEWKSEQMEDGNGLPPITLESIEPAFYKPKMSLLLTNETGRNFRNVITDLELCSLIDGHYLNNLNKKSIYELTETERNNLGNQIYADLKSGTISKLLGRISGLPNIDQIKRCAVIK